MRVETIADAPAVSVVARTLYATPHRGGLLITNTVDDKIGTMFVPVEHATRLFGVNYTRVEFLHGGNREARALAAVSNSSLPAGTFVASMTAHDRSGRARRPTNSTSLAAALGGLGA